MAHFLVEYLEIGSPEQRTALRGEHIAYRKGLGDHLPLAGPILDDTGRPIGSLVIVEAADQYEATRIATADPYVTAEVFKLVSVRPYRIAALRPVAST
jgi:uncharacterized protein YciI